VSIGMGSTVGTYKSPVNLYAANIGCRQGGAGSAYPVQCPASDRPITFANAGPNGSSVYGTVCATDQPNGVGIYPGQIGQGWIPNCVAPGGSMPVFDKQGFVNSMNTPAQNASNANCDGHGNTVTWNANTIFNNNVSFSQTCKVTVKGNVYIKGNLSTNIFVHFLVDESVSSQPVIVVNGKVNINYSRVSANTAGTPMRIISFDSSDSSCTQSDSCNALGSYDDIYNSVSRIATDCLGNPHGDLPGLVMQAYYATAHVGQNCDLGSVAGQAVYFDYNSGTSLVGQLSLEGTVTISGWKIVDYQQLY
jgi:hypothetical protein